MGSPCGAHAELARGATRGPFGRYTWDPYGPHHGPIWAPHGQSIRATCGPHEGGPTGQLWAAHAGPTQNWPRGPQWAHSGDTRGTHLGPTMDPSGLHTDSPYGPQMGPMRVAQRALYGRPTWDPDRIGQGATRGPYRRDTWDPSGPQQGPICTPHGQSIGPHVAPCGWPKGLFVGGPHGNQTELASIDPNGQETHFGIQKPDVLYGPSIASCCQPMLVQVTIEDGCS